MKVTSSKIQASLENKKLQIKISNEITAKLEKINPQLRTYLQTIDIHFEKGDLSEEEARRKVYTHLILSLYNKYGIPTNKLDNYKDQMQELGISYSVTKK